MRKKPPYRTKVNCMKISAVECMKGYDLGADNSTCTSKWSQCKQFIIQRSRYNMPFHQIQKCKKCWLEQLIEHNVTYRFTGCCMLAILHGFQELQFEICTFQRCIVYSSMHESKQRRCATWCYTRTMKLQHHYFELCIIKNTWSLRYYVWQYSEAKDA